MAIIKNQETVINTDNIRIRIMILAAEESVGWHYHSSISDNMFCLEGTIRIETKNPDNFQILQTGERCQIDQGQIHRVLNPTSKTSRYLLIQGVGPYDFNKA